jgi:hypothetical protein
VPAAPLKQAHARVVPATHRPLENLQAAKKVPKPVSSRLRFLKAILALDALYGISNVVLSAHADKVRMAIFFELNDGVP